MITFTTQGLKGIENKAISISSMPQTHSCLVFSCLGFRLQNSVLMHACECFGAIFFTRCLFSLKYLWCVGLFFSKCISKRISIYSFLPRTLVCTSWAQAACWFSCRLWSLTITLFSSSSITSTFSESGLHTAFSET